jgi:hypothetical protein
MARDQGEHGPDFAVFPSPQRAARPISFVMVLATFGEQDAFARSDRNAPTDIDYVLAIVFRIDPLIRIAQRAHSALARAVLVSRDIDALRGIFCDRVP